MQRFAGIFLVAATLGFAELPRATPSECGFDESRLAVANATMRASVENGEHAGIVTLLLRNGRVADVQTYGHRDREQKLPMERDTICRMYSMTKIVTSVAVLCLFEDGRFNLDDPVSRFLPELANMKVMTGGSADAPQLVPMRGPLTIKHLLTHTGGFIYDFDGDDALHQIYQRANLWGAPRLADFVKKAGQLPLKHEPGTTFSYGISADLLGALIERVSGKSFGAFLQERIFQPLDMRDTGFDVPANKLLRLAVTYRHAAGGALTATDPMLAAWSEPGRGIESGGAGLFGTADDFARFGQMLCNGGILDGQRILGRKTVELMTANHLTSLPGRAHAFDPSKGFGLGVEVTIDPGKGAVPTSLGQFGWFGAANTNFQVDPKEKIVAIVLAQHFPFNEHKLFARWTTAYYQALK
jgi:CubicO group peptidase (beta-lactamase class C family)